jgi:hypothetical protein
VEVQILAKGVNGHDDAGDASGRPRLVRRDSIRHSWATRQRSLSKIAVVAEVRAEHLGDAEHEMPVRHRIGDALGRQRHEELDLLLVAGGAEPGPLQEKANRRSSSRYLPQQICCPECGAIRSHKGKHQIVLRALFGKLRLDSPVSTIADVAARRSDAASVRLQNCCRSEQPRNWLTWKARLQL